ncbi:FAD-dependent monooxygenase [Candidatus Protofrankia californiensis]|uniref:FAD-dependent monooxygenase n=1 Tax=Candidatus Protofrankia californiensis TaxID=1839754 RepID=UPI0013EA17A7|nr:FAD-dependent monooxygenase [Candidatus Protofrankia californiensis]
MMDPDVIIVGAGPTGLMLASELRLAGVRPLVLERQPLLWETPKANGFSGQIVELLRYRGLLERVEAASVGPIHTAPRVQFGGVHLDLSPLAVSPIWGVHLPQPRLERLLDEHARELGAVIRRGHEVLGIGQDDAAVTADVRGPQGLYRARAHYLVGCDGPRSRVRDLAGIDFAGTTYPEANRLGQVTLPDSVTRLDNGDLDLPGLGRVRAGSFTRTGRGVFGFGWLTPEVLLVQTTEDEPADVDEDEDEPMTLTEFQDSIRRVLGADLPVEEVIRLSRYGFQARQAERYRDGRFLLAGDAAHQFPATGIGINVGMLDAVNLAWKLAADIHGWAPTGLLDTYHDERHFAGARAMLQTQAQVALRRGQDPAADALRELFLELCADEQPLHRIGTMIAGADVRYPPHNPNQHALTGAFAPNLTLHTGQGATSVAELGRTARPILLDLADRPELRAAAQDWQHRIDIHSAKTDQRPADALLIRPDAYIAWAAALDETVDTAGLTLRAALSRWFGTPEMTAPAVRLS